VSIENIQPGDRAGRTLRSPSISRLVRHLLVCQANGVQCVMRKRREAA